TDNLVVLSAKDLASTVSDIKAGSIVAYTPDGKRKSYKLEAKFNVIRNNISHPYYTAEDLMLTNGQLKLLDNNGNGAYDVVFIEEYTLHFINTAFYDEKTLTFIDSEGKRVDLDRETLTITAAGSGSIGPKKIAQNTVIKFFGNDDGKYCRIDLYESAVTGKIDAISTEGISVNMKEYPFSLVYKNSKPDVAPKLCDTVDLFIDETGEVIWVWRNLDAINDSWTLAYSQDYYISPSLSSDVMLRLFTINGTWVEAGIADKVTVDGSILSKSNFVALVKNTAEGRFTGELIRYQTNGKGLINKIDTVEETDAEKAMGTSLVRGATISSGLYTDHSSAFWSGQQMISLARDDTPLFTIPKDSSGGNIQGKSYDKYFRINKLTSEVTSHRQYSGTLYSYMPDEDGYPVCFVRNTTVSTTSGGGELNEVQSSAAPFLLVSKVSSGMNDEGSVATKITGRQITSNGMGSEVTIYAESTLDIIETGLLFQEQPQCLNSTNMVMPNSVLSLGNKDRYIKNVSVIGFGDLLRYQTQTGNNVRAIERVFDYDPNVTPAMGDNPYSSIWYGTGNNVESYTIYYRYQLGDLAKVSDEAFTVTTLAGNTETYIKKKFGSVLVCEDNGLTSTIASAKLDKYQGSNAKIMLFTYLGN
ncbi:MAG: hypothetical protein ACI4QW_05215, partial [Clostridia bacterium]